MTHGTKIVDFIGLDIGDNGDEIRGVTEITIVEEELHAGVVAVAVNVVDTAGVERRRATDDSVDLYRLDGERKP